MSGENCKLANAAVVTGAARGIGLEVTRDFLAAGIAVLAADRDGPELERATAELREAGARLETVVCDLADADAPTRVIDAGAEAFGGLDVLVNNAAIAPPEAFLEVSAASLGRTIAVNLEAPYRLAQEFVRRALARGHGAAIVNLASINGIVGVGRMSAYGVAKAGIASLTRSIAVEHAADGIRCNAVAPGPTETRLLDGLRGAERERRLERIPQRRFGTVADVAAAIAFLASPAASYINGHVIPVEGGYLALGTT